jgi:beta-phosphoglucomutase-like phosphatase (HAD superfamily)
MAIATRIVRPQRAGRRPTPVPPPVTLDALGVRWRFAFDAAEDALHASSGCGRSLRFPPGELAARGTLLARERAETARVLDEIAREEHVHLVHRLSAPRATRRMLGLPAGVQALVLALDGVLAASSDLHAAAWQETFEELLAHRAGRPGEHFAPSNSYDPRTDYRAHLHGRPRLEGVRTFLASRGITLSEGAASDPPDAETVHGLANRKNLALRRLLDRDSVAAFEGSRRYLEDAREAGLRAAVVSSSSNTAEILERSGLAVLVDVCIDGDTMRELGLRPRPAPDTFVAACRLLGVEPADAAGFVTSSAGIAGLRAAGFGSTVGVSRDGVNAEGANRVVLDLAELLDPVLRD